MKWNLENIRFLYQPDDFVGSFTNEKMQQRHEAMRQQKLDALLNDLKSSTSPTAALRVLHKNDQLQFLLNNFLLFSNAGELEKMILTLYQKENTPFSSGGDYSTWVDLFTRCNHEKLAQIGTKVTTETITAYRGSVIGKVRGLSWCTNKETVGWFLERWGNKEEGGGTLCRATFAAKDILLFLNTEKYQEVIVHPSVIESTPLTEIESI